MVKLNIPVSGTNSELIVRTKMIIIIIVILVAVVMTTIFYFDGRFDIYAKENSKTLDVDEVMIIPLCENVKSDYHGHCLIPKSGPDKTIYMDGLD